MQPVALDKLTTEQLVDRFAAIGEAQHVACNRRDTRRYNRLYRQIDAVDKELHRRGPEARAALKRLYVHPDIQVRTMAGQLTADEFPAEVRPVLEAIRDSWYIPYCVDASFCLDRIDGKN